MIPAIIQPIVRRAILDLMNEVGGEHNDDVLTRLLNAMGHRVARRDVSAELGWLDAQGLVRSEALEPEGKIGAYVVARILQDGQDVADGRLRVEGIHRHKTGE